MTVPVVILLVIALFAGAWLYGKWRTLRRAEFIRTFRWPRGLLERLEKHHPGLCAQGQRAGLARPAAILPRLSDERQAPRLDALAGRRRSLARIHPVHARLRRVLPPRLRRLPPPHPGRRPQRAPQEQRRPAPCLVVLLQIREHRSGPPDAPAAVVCARQQAQYRKRVRLSSRLRSAAQERQRCGVLRRRFRGYVVRRQFGRVWRCRQRRKR